MSFLRLTNPFQYIRGLDPESESAKDSQDLDHFFSSISKRLVCESWEVWLHHLMSYSLEV